MKNASTIIIALSLIIAFILVLTSAKNDIDIQAGGNVYMEGEKQIVEITARGGYSPQVSTASSSVPTILRMKTADTFDCSSFVVIPSKNISMTLPQSGTTDIDLGTPSSGTLDGTCSMGMYRFSISFVKPNI